MDKLKSLVENMSRKKAVDNMDETSLKKCLTLSDLILFGMGHMMGAGIFVVTGAVAKNNAGPGVIISYMLAGLAALLSSLCYAEFGARVPRAGSAYTYTYITIGEFPAFLIGWNMLLEYILGASSVAKAWSGSVDILFDKAISNGTAQYIGTMNASGIDTQPDFLAVGCALFWTIFIAAGAKISSTFNNILTILNISVLLFIIGLGLGRFADIKNWTNEKKGGFLPYGFSGVLAGSASCFYSYAGFEGIATASEETMNPAKNIPIATSVSVISVLVLYIAASSSLTLMMPYNLIDVAAPFPAAFRYKNCEWATIVVSIGAIIGLSAALLGSLFVVPRGAYAMANDGLLFRCFSYVHPKTQTPIIATVIFGIITALIALFFDLATLVELLSIGTLMSYTIVAVNVIILRYQPVSMCQFQLRPDISTYSLQAESSLTEPEKIKLMKKSQSHDDIGKLKKHFNFSILKSIPPGCVGLITIFLMIIFCICDWLILLYAFDLLINGVWWIITLLILSSLGFIFSYSVLWAHEQNTSFLTFQVPLVPFIPVANIIVNIGLMLNLKGATWIRLLIWLFIGILIYFFYGIRNSNENEKLLSYKTMVSYSADGLTDINQNKNSENAKENQIEEK